MSLFACLLWGPCPVVTVGSESILLNSLLAEDQTPHNSNSATACKLGVHVSWMPRTRTTFSICGKKHTFSIRHRVINFDWLDDPVQITYKTISLISSTYLLTGDVK
jgi:hypothetical protein